MNNFFSRNNSPRQEWNPHWSIRILLTVLKACVGVFKIALGAAVTVILICLVCGFVFAGILGDYLQDDILPDTGFELTQSELDQTSFMYYVDRNGDIQQLQQIYTTIDRQWAPLDEIPKDLIHAAVAIEDKRFYEHQGVDWITSAKACVNLFFGSGSKFGGSTITQQLIKNRTGDDSVTVQRKVAEIFKAQQAEKRYNKDQIMEEYLNTIYLGRGCYGVKSAAAKYFGKELRTLTAAECASLISITNNPSIYDPYREAFEEGGKTGAERNRIRQLHVLDEMLDQGWLTQEEYDEAVAQELVFKSGIANEDRIADCPNSECGYYGTVNTFVNQNGKYYCPKCGTEVQVAINSSQYVYSWYVETVLDDVAAVLAERDGIDWELADKDTRKMYIELIQRGGYHIYTCLDMDVQNAVDQIYTNLAEIPTARSNQQLQSAIVVINNETGDIAAISGGVGEKVVFDAYNRAVDAKLQTGSSQKPISVYAPAFESGLVSPVTVIKDMPISYAGGNFPKNDNRRYDYSRTVLQGIVSSVNAISVNTLDRIGIDYAFDFATGRLHIDTLVDEYIASNGKVLSDKGYSPLGMGALTFGATVRDMSTAYATFANNGVYRDSRTFTKVYDSEGNLIIDNTQTSEQAMSPKAANYLNYCLYNAVQSGTGGAARMNNMNVAGKTGTTGEAKDRWFCGFTGYYTAAVWCGYDTPESINLTGYDRGNPAARLWKKVMAPIHAGLPNRPVYNGDSFVGYSVCLDSGGIPTDACKKDIRTYENGLPRVASANAALGDGPKEPCDKHVLVDYCLTGGGVATEYCRKFAEVEGGPEVKIEERALVKMTEDEIEEIKKASQCGLKPEFTNDSYVYYVSNGGKDLPWHGFKGDANPNSDAPYIVCPVHTKEAWEAYEQEQKDKEEEEKRKEEEEQKRREEEEKKQQEAANQNKPGQDKP